MNQRINALAEQAHEYASNDPRANITVSYIEIFEKKFAQLLIQECAKHITNQQDLVETNWQCKDGIHIVHSLKEHFGVEE